jgi:glycosyltransferase involved in cell wall biosynthesis
MKRPLVSVIIPVHNGARFIADALESVYIQNYEPLEIIIVDDGSTDDTSVVVRSFRDIRYFRQENRGVSSARNAGIGEGKGELVAFLDSDDCWAADKLNIQVGCLLKHPHIGYTLGMQRNFLESGIERPFWLREEHLQREHTGFLPTSVIHKSVFEQVGLFNPAYRICEDVEWFSRVKDFGIPMMVVPEVVLYRRIHASNLSYQLKAGNPLLLAALRTSVRRKYAKKSTGEADKGPTGSGGD